MSCNVAFMKMGEALGVKNTLQFEQIFNIGLKTEYRPYRGSEDSIPGL